MERRIASIIVLIHPQASIERLNRILSKYAPIILSRSGLNLSHRNLRIISLIVEASPEQISALSGNLGLIRGVKVKSAILKPYSHANDLSP